MNLGLVVSTLGRIAPLRRLLDSLEGQLASGDRVAIVAQDRAGEVRAVVDGHTLGSQIVVAESARGLSLGRNTGVRALGDGGPRLLLFPNDTTWFPVGALDRLREAAGAGADAAGVGLGAITVADEHGPKFELPAAGTPLDRWNVWSVIEIGLVIRDDVFRASGGFDETLGTGAPTPWQAGEGTDLLLRLLAADPGLADRFTWFPPTLVVGGVADAHGLSASERRRKLRAYGRGIGRVVVRHRYPLWWVLAFVGGGLAFGLRNRDGYAIADGWWVFVGRVEGTTGRTFGRAQLSAVTR